MKIETVVYGEPASKKNSQQIAYNPKTKRPFIMQNARYKQYERNTVHQLKKLGIKDPIAEPVNVKCIFYRQTHRRIDLSNLISAISDVLVVAGVLEDDNSTVIVGYDGSRVRYDKDNPRTEIVIETLEEE